MTRAYFSIDEAEAHVPAVSTLLVRAQELRTQLDLQERVTQQIMTSGEEVVEEELADLEDPTTCQLKEELYDTLERIEKRGCFLRDLDQGVVDFPTRFEGRDVYLSWELGQKRIRYWHEADETVSERKRIVELK